MKASCKCQPWRQNQNPLPLRIQCCQLVAHSNYQPFSLIFVKNPIFPKMINDSLKHAVPGFAKCAFLHSPFIFFKIISPQLFCTINREKTPFWTKKKETEKKKHSGIVLNENKVPSHSGNRQSRDVPTPRLINGRANIVSQIRN